ncbi:MAG: hypothetical protein IKH81_02125 [Clostridia bacterium]|nr:hypothetical protein [Clostridia bacterium]
MTDNRDTKNARAEMELAKRQSEKTFSADPKRPGRYRLYDRIRDRVSLRTVDWVIVITSVLLIVFLIFGILTRNPAQ